MNGLFLHCGANYVNRSELGKVTLPAATETHVPVNHDYLVDVVQDALENRGLRVVDEAFGLGQEGHNMFGLLEVQGDTAKFDDHSLMVGLRNSHMKWFAASMAVGSRVFVCDNLAFSGEISVGRKHTANILSEDTGLRSVVELALDGFVDNAERQEVRFEAYKRRELKTYEAEHLMVESLRRGIMNAQRLPKLVEQWDNPDHEEFKVGESGWRFFNGVTESLKGLGLYELPRRTQKLEHLLDEVCEVEFDLAA